MDFLLTEEHQEVVKVVRDFCRKEIAPVIKEADRTQTMHPSILPRMGELGILGICVPERYGGQGFDYITLGLVWRNWRSWIPRCGHVSAHGVEQPGDPPVGDREQKQKYRPAGEGREVCDVLADEAAWMATWPDPGERDYILNGEKMWISLATKAHHILWVARTNPERPDPHDQLSAFILETSWPGVTRGDIHGKLGVRAGSTGWVSCQDVRVPAANRLGEEGG
jgi:glutaryl-CoA dehydrogenase (non-decarboxylating)